MRIGLVVAATSSTLALTVAMGVSPARAQDAANPAPPTAGSAARPADTVAPNPLASSSRPRVAPQVAEATVDAIVVTAQRRTQSLQDVPIVVTTVTRQLLQDTGVRDIKDLSLLTPGLLVTSTTSESSTSARIRGIGTVGDNIGLESSVGVSIDGVYRPRNGVGFGDLGDVDRIEVLKGPQGTLFGKSTSAGVINVITAQPSFTPGAAAEFTFGNYNSYGGSASVTGPIIADKLAASLYVADRQRDGFYDVNTGQGPRTETRDQNRNFYTVRGQLLAKPTDQLSVRFIADYTHRDEDCCVAVLRNEGATGPIVAALGGAGGGEPQTPNPFNRVAYANQRDAQDVYDGGVSMEVNYRLPSLNANLTSVTAYRTWKSLDGSDLDFTNADLLNRPSTSANSDQFKDFSQELRFAGTVGKLDYLVGGFYAHENLQSNFSLLYGQEFGTYLSLLFSGGANPAFLNDTFGPTASPVGGQGAIDTYRQTDNTYAVFTNETFHVTSKLEVNVGLRYTEDDKTLNSLDTNTPTGGLACGTINSEVGQLPVAALQQIIAITCLPFESPAYNNFANHQDSSEHELSGTAKLSYRFNPQLLTYLSYARGFKAGGFNLDRVGCPNAPGCALGSLTPVSDTGFPAEIADSYEAGVKSTLLHRTLILNATLFNQNFSNFQLNTFNGLVFVVDSVPNVSSKGVDADFVWLPMHGLSFQGGVTLADTRFTHADQASLEAADSGQFQGSPGSRLPLAPEYSASLSATYSHDLIDGLVGRLNFGGKYSSTYNTGSDLDPRKVQKAFALFNARLAIGPQDSRWSVEFWAENLFDRNYIQVAFDAPFQNAPTNGTGVIDAFLGQPRTFGMTLRAKY